MRRYGEERSEDKGRVRESRGEEQREEQRKEQRKEQRRPKCRRLADSGGILHFSLEVHRTETETEKLGVGIMNGQKTSSGRRTEERTEERTKN